MPADGTPEQGLPEYAPLLAARHAAHRTELHRLIEQQWGGGGLAVLDVACGDGFYTAAFERLLGATARVVAVDLSLAFLRWAVQCAHEGAPGGSRSSFIAADAERLPFADESFDLVWCAQSLISLPRPVVSLREMARVARPGATVAILENDRLHELQLPWPAELEIALREAERRAEPDFESAEKPHAGRRLECLMLEAGLQPSERISVVIDRTAPLEAADEAFLQAYFHALLERAGDELEPAQRAELLRLSAPDSPDYLPAQPTFWMTWSDVVVLGRRPEQLAAE